MSRVMKMEEKPQKSYMEQIYRIYEYDDGLFGMTRLCLIVNFHELAHSNALAY